jgi:hypothetical protein
VSTFAGTLPTMTLGETCAVTTAPAATTDPAPIVTPGSTVTLAPSQTSSSMTMGAENRWSVAG